ncbi:MAG: hypothetical protein GY765_00975, partial [bacterium]|nr:hypothetical protein [bacterium]
TLYARECPENIETLKTLLEAGRYKPLTELKILHETKGKDYLIIQTNFCDGCRALYVLDISVVRSKLPGSGPDNRGERTVVSKLLIDARVYRALQGSPVSGVSDEKTG